MYDEIELREIMDLIKSNSFEEFIAQHPTIKSHRRWRNR
jgi:hypothetical protein